MGDWQRSTAERSFGDLTPAVLVEDTGLEVFGFVPFGASDRGSALIGLGPEPASRRLEEALGLSP